MYVKPSCLLVAAAVSFPLCAQTVVVPEGAATNEGYTSTSVAWSGNDWHIQTLYGASNFTNQGIHGPIVIHSLAWRADGGAAAGGSTHPSVAVSMSTAATSWQTISTVFANQHGGDQTAVFSGPVTTQVPAGTTPNSFFVTLNLTTSFRYDPSAGRDLVVDLNRFGNGSGTLTRADLAVGDAAWIGSPNPNSPTSFPPTQGDGFVIEIGYTPLAGAAIRNQYGAGCPDQFASFFERFTSVNPIDLSGSAGAENVIRMTYTGSGYVVTPGVSSWFTPTSTPLVLGDDANSAPQTMPFVLSYPGGSSSTVVLGSNGYIYVGTAASAAPFLGGYGFQQGPARHAPFWTDLDPSAGGSVHFDVDPSGNVVYATWVAVPQWAVRTSISTFQIAIEANGDIEYRYRACSMGGSFSEGLTGWTPGMARDPGPMDISAALATGFATAPDAVPIDLSCSARPVLGTNVDLVLGNLPAGTAYGFVFLGLQRTAAPGLSLDTAIGGMEGCYQHVQLPLETYGVVLSPSSTATLPLAIPANASLLGLQAFAQVLAVTNPPAFTTSGALTSNGLMLELGNQ